MSHTGNYHVAFIDILGFKDLVYTHSQKYVIDIFKSIIYSTEKLMSDLYKIKIFIRIMSDSVVVACDTDIPGSLLAVCFCAGRIQEGLITKGIFVRGGISEGEFYAEDEIMFGKGLVNAYVLENDIAKVPRIVVDSKVLQKYVSYIDNNTSKELLSVIEKSYDDIYYIDWITFLRDSERCEERFKQLTDIIIDKLNTTSISPSVREKYMWLKEEINDYAMRNEEMKKHEIDIRII